MSFPAQLLGMHRVLRVLPGDAPFHHLAKGVPVRFPHCELTVFPCVIGRWMLWEDTLRLYRYSVSHQAFVHQL